MFLNLLKQTTLLAGLGAVTVFAAPAMAQETEESNFSQAALVEFTYDHAGDLDVLAATVEYGAALRVGEGWTVQMDAVLEPVEDVTGDSAFEGEDAYVETLSVQYAGEGFTLYGGKINPVFGTAADLAPGLYGVEAGEEYQITEQLGLGGDILLPGMPGFDGEHVLSAAIFRADRTVLSGSVGGKRARLRLEDGGLANTSGLKSFAVSLDGAMANGLSYSFGYRQMATDTPGETDESTVVVGVAYASPEDADMDIGLVAEYAASRDAHGIAGAHRDLYTVGGTLGLGDWFVSAVISGWNENAAAGNADLRKYELSVGRGLAEGITLDFGVQDVRADGDSETVLGARLSFEFG